MMRPLGLYLAEFRTDGATPGPAPSSPAPSPVEAALDLSPMELPDPAITAFPEHTPFPAFDDDEPLPTLAAPAEAELDIVALLAMQQAEHDAALEAARAAWARAEGAVLAERIDQGLAALEGRLADALATVLEPFLAKAARAKALDGLHDMLGTLLDSHEARAVAVSGAADLVGALRDSYGDRPGLSFTEADTPDVAVTLGDTRIRSQLRAWTRTLESALQATPGASA